MADFAQSVLRRLKDIYENPRLHLERTGDNLRNKLSGLEAVIRPEGAGMRQMTEKQRNDAAVQAVLDNLGGGGMGALGIIKTKGGNWLTGSVEDALGRLKKAQYRELHTPDEKAINKWIEGPLTKYVKRDMATEGDPVRKLAEQGILHIDANPGLEEAANRMRSLADQHVRTPDLNSPGTVLSKSPLARVWEDFSDAAVGTQPVGVRKRYEYQMENNPWMSNLPDDALVYHFSNPTDSLGFPHLIDELSNALNPESGLPRNLLLNPEDFQQMGMERAVRHVDNINKWRAAQKAEADAIRANNAATVLHKEYPENNPMGLRWVELKQQEPTLGEGWSVKEAPWGGVEIFDELGRQRSVGATKEEALGLLNREERRQALADALKYEGDTMGHCVGGYCDDVVSGRSRIYSLRDTKGQPHVTIETRPEQLADDPHWFFNNMIQPSRKEDFYKLADEAGYGPRDLEFWDVIKDAVSKSPEWQEYRSGPSPESIIQIKGKQNRAPNPEYLPFVQDFVKSGKWSEVGDLGNTGLYRRSSLTPDEQALVNTDFLTMDEIKALREGKSWTPIDNDLADW